MIWAAITGSDDEEEEYKGGMPAFIIDDFQVEALKQTLEAQNVDTEATGLTAVRLRKMIIANIVSTSLDNVIVLAPISEEDIVKNCKAKDEEAYKNCNSLSECLDSWQGTIKSSDDWPLNVDYDLYYDSNTFFYFKDSEKIFATEQIDLSEVEGLEVEESEDGVEPESMADYDGWYLAARGATTFTTQNVDAGDSAEAVGLKAYDAAKWEELLASDMNNEDNRKALESAYLLIDSETIRLAYLSSKEGTANTRITYGDEKVVEDIDNEWTDLGYTVQTQDVKLTQEVDTANYAIPLSLMVDYITVTGSGEFLETFIDYALNNIEVKIDGYITQDISYSYYKSQYDIPESDLIFETYDMQWRNDGWGDINFNVYKDIYFNRKYDGNAIKRVTDIDGFDDINDSGAGPLTRYIKNEYKPGSGFDKYNNFKVEEIQVIKETAQKWNLCPSQVVTWYGTTNFEKPSTKMTYLIGVGEAQNEEDFNEYGMGQDEYTDLGFSKEEDSVASIERRYLSNLYQSKLNETEKNAKGLNMLNGDRIFDSELKIKKKEDSDFFDVSARIIHDIGEIAGNDDGEYNDISTYSDYIYAFYPRNNFKRYNTLVKVRSEMIDKSNVTVKMGGNEDEIEAKLREFLALLKNQEGTLEGRSTGFSKDGKVVLYGDIYDGTIPVGDLLLDNGAEVLFECLEADEETQSMVIVFKYLAQLYTGLDYGVTIDDLTSVFSLYSISGIYGNSIEEKLWFALKGIGCTDEAAAAALGNLYQESGLQSNNLQNTFNTKFGMSDEQYTNAVDSKTYSKASFISDSGGYGLAQWTDGGRKSALYKYVVETKHASIADEQSQIEFLISEITGEGPAKGIASFNFKNKSDFKKWKESKSIEEATVLFCSSFERAGIPNNSARIQNAKRYYSQLQGMQMMMPGSFNGDFLQVAKQCHEYLRINNYYYSSSLNKKAGRYVQDQSSTGSSIPKPAKGEGTWVDCSSYVSWVLYEYGYKKEFGGWQHLASSFIDSRSRFEKFGWKYKSARNAQAGDIIVRGDHIEIYAGNGTFLNCGTTEAIRRPLDDGHWGTNYLGNFTYAITVTPPPAGQS